ncbi:unnamed protein product [Staurois parvus]|uniref:Uncharacterized protein n=1 Tax=Staurois parvus TaxID=386267 RepID=A0ABN9GT72_9NEOB|nr:unnamed protein product [Staurois parvus]
MTAGTGLDIGSSDWTAGIGSPGIKSFGSTASTASSGKAVGSESTGMTAGPGADIESSAGQRGHRVTRHQVIWLDSGHRVIWQGSGLRVNRHDKWAPGHQVPDCLARQRAIGSSGIRSFGLPAGTASSGKAVGTESLGTTAGSVVNWHDSGHRIIWINSGYRVNWPNRIVRLDSVHHAG